MVNKIEHLGIAVKNIESANTIYEKLLGIKTHSIVNLANLTLAGEDSEQNHHYQGASYFILFSIFNELPKGKKNQKGKIQMIKDFQNKLFLNSAKPLKTPSVWVKSLRVSIVSPAAVLIFARLPQL